MKLQLLATSVLLLSFTGKALAQKVQVDTVTKKKTIIVHKKSSDNQSEKMTVEVNGDKILLNGKPVDGMKDVDVEILNGDSHDMRTVPDMRMMPDGQRGIVKSFSVAGNKAVLGVTTEKVDNGAKILDVGKESAAAKAGLQKDDIISKVNDAKIESSEDLYTAIGKYKVGDKVNITYLRNGKENTTTATLATNKFVTAYSIDRNFNYNMQNLPQLKEFNGKTFNFSYTPRKPRLGLQIQDVENGSGVKVLDVDDDTPASKAGLKEGDILTDINGKEIKSVDDVREKTKDLKDGDSFQIKYKRDGKTQSTEIKVPKKLKTADL